MVLEQMQDRMSTVKRNASQILRIFDSLMLRGLIQQDLADRVLKVLREHVGSAHRQGAIGPSDREQR